MCPNQCAFSPPRAEYNYGIIGNVLWIEDTGKNTRSVTNDMINVLNDIIKDASVNLLNLRIIYRDSDGNWDGVIPHMTSGWVFSVGFYPLNTKDTATAIKNAK